MSFFKNSSHRKLRKFFKKRGFELTEGGEHSLAIHKRTGQVFSYPRHNTISNGVTKEICKRLLELGYDKGEIEREILK
jgi:energy-coupling factor transporter ATP-binding protein EcfA2